MTNPAGRRRSNTLSADKYLRRIKTYHPDQLHLKEELVDIFSHGEEGETLLKHIREELNNRLLVSDQVVPNPEIYRNLRCALESSSIEVPTIVPDTMSGSFVEKRFIAAVLNRPQDRVTRDSLLM